MPAAKLRPVAPSTTTRPPVMYSQPWSPSPSTTVQAPELRAAKPSPAGPRKKARPAAATPPPPRHRPPRRAPAAEALPRRALEVHLDRVLRQAPGPVAHGDVA